MLGRGGRGRGALGSARLPGAARGHRLRERRVPLAATGTRLLGQAPHLAPQRGTNTPLAAAVEGSFLAPCVSS